MPATINGTTGFGGNLTGNVTGNVTGTSSAIADGAVSAAKLDGAQSGSAPVYGCRAWVNFDGATVTNVGGENRCTMRASGNVSKVVRNSTGNFTVHFTTAMPSANYAAVMYNNASSSGTTSTSFNNSFHGGIGDKTTTTVGVTSYTTNPSPTYINSTLFDVIIFG